MECGGSFVEGGGSFFDMDADGFHCRGFRIKIPLRIDIFGLLIHIFQLRIGIFFFQFGYPSLHPAAFPLQMLQPLEKFVQIQLRQVAVFLIVVEIKHRISIYNFTIYNVLFIYNFTIYNLRFIYNVSAFYDFLTVPSPFGEG